MHYRFRETIYHITVIQKQGSEKEGGQYFTTTITVDGVAQPGKTVALVDDGQEHGVEIVVERGILERRKTKSR
jgi:cellobiose phosphorylase